MRVSSMLWKHKIDVQMSKYSGTFLQIYNEDTDPFNVIDIIGASLFIQITQFNPKEMRAGQMAIAI